MPQRDWNKEFFDENYKLVYQRCFSIVKDADAAHDLAVNALIKLYEEEKAQKNIIKTVGGWLYTVASRLSLNEKKRKKAESLPLSIKQKPDRNNFADSQDPVDFIKYLIETKLTEQERKVIYMVEKGFDDLKIGETLNIAKRTVSDTKYRARKKLREAISSDKLI